MKLTYEELEKKVVALEEQIQLVGQLESAIKNHKHFLDILFDTIPNPVFYKDTKGFYKRANNAFSKTILGLNKEDIIGRSLFSLPDVIPYELALLYEAKDNELFTNPGLQIYNGNVKCADGITRTFNFNKATVKNECDEVIGLVGVMLDITEGQ